MVIRLLRSTLQASSALVKFRKAWFKVTLRTPQALVDGTQYNSVTTLKYAKCADHLLGTAQSIYYLDNRVVETDVTEPARISFSEVIPESNGEAMLDRLCSRKNSGKKKE